MLATYSFSDAQRLIIKPFERLRFIILFVLATGLGQIVGSLICWQPSFADLAERSPMIYGIIRGLIPGTLAGAAQWLTIRQYVPDWKWILVVALSATFSASIQSAMDIHTDRLMVEQRDDQVFIVQMLFTILLIVSNFIYGYLQWYILRRWVSNARWWMFTLYIAWLPGFSLILIGLLLRLSTRNFLGLNHDIILLTGVPVTQAICFCILKKKPSNEELALRPSIALAPDIVDYWDTKKLGEKLYARISRIWATDLGESIGKLSYLVGVNRNASMIVYESTNQHSNEHIDQTPLTEFASNFNSVTLEGDAEDFAKFQVVFTPPCTVQVYSWRGIPLIGLGVAAYVGIIGVGILCDWFQIDLLSYVQ